ncbi:DUF1670 domain-containing protein, partial [Sphingobacteriales bacterium CHB3]|nr:DUF1670 domain-containing protein [Sphingobacteriales bacterium CHB3]
MLLHALPEQHVQWDEAYQQSGLLTQEDIGRILQVSERTIRSDI